MYLCNPRRYAMNKFKTCTRACMLAVAAGVMGIAAVSCGNVGKKVNNCTEPASVPLKYAANLRIKEFDGYTQVTVRNPWDTVRILDEYVLIPKELEIPDNLPEGIVIRTPVDNALVFSTVHNSLLIELGAIEAIGGICDMTYINNPALKERIASGVITDCGSSQNPAIEQIMKQNPEAILLSPYQNGGQYAKVKELGIPVVECADYMETSPLGRAEWVRFYGMLFGKRAQADSLFANTEMNYQRLKKMAANVGKRPKVLMDQRYGQVWYVPGDESTTGRIIGDAGGVNPFAGYKQSGSVALSPEKVLYDAQDADIWFIKYHQKNEKTMREFAADASVNSQFKAFSDGNVYGCNTQYVDFFDETPFHPDRLLEDYIYAMHPELNPGAKLNYFKKLQ